MPIDARRGDAESGGDRPDVQSWPPYFLPAIFLPHPGAMQSQFGLIFLPVIFCPVRLYFSAFYRSMLLEGQRTAVMCSTWRCNSTKAKAKVSAPVIVS